MFAEAQFWIPLLFVFAVAAGGLSYARVFTAPVRVVVALVLAVFAASYPPFVAVLWAYLPAIVWFFIIMFFVAFVMHIFGIRHREAAPTETLIIGGFALLLLLSVGLSVLQFFPLRIPFIGGGENIILIIGLALIVAIFILAARIKPPKEV